MWIIKICLFGNSSVGKTTLREQYVGKGTDFTYLMTAGAYIVVRKTTIKNREVKLEIWEHGCVRFESAEALYYKDLHGIFFVFDITRPNTLDYIVKNCVRDLKKYMNGSDLTGSVPIMVVGNKIDLRDSDDSEYITRAQGLKVTEDIAKSINAEKDRVIYVETSAKTGENVEQIFTRLADIIVKEYIKKNMLQTDKQVY